VKQVKREGAPEPATIVSPFSSRTPDMMTPAFTCRLPRRAFGAAILLSGFAGAAWAQSPSTWPTQTVKILVGFPGGSTPDVAARILAEGLAKVLGQPVVVENRPGAAGNVAADAVAKARDEHTLGVVINGNLTSAKMLNPRLAFDPAKDFAPISLLATAPLVLVTNADKPAGRDFFAAAKAAGKSWSYGSVGIGSVGHLGMELLKAKAGAPDAVHVPYNGNPAVITALISGQVQMGLMPPGIALPQAQSGKVRVIGVTGPKSALAPEIEPLTALGVPIDDLEVWTAVVAPSALSGAALQRLAREVPAVLQGAEVKTKLLAAGWVAQGLTPEATRTRIEREAQVLGDIIRSQGIKLE
jgi:tripartite-type tricarboxylate transporter receptor subunit TctC